MVVLKEWNSYILKRLYTLHRVDEQSFHTTHHAIQACLHWRKSLWMEAIKRHIIYCHCLCESHQEVHIENICLRISAVFTSFVSSTILQFMMGKLQCFNQLLTHLNYFQVCCFPVPYLYEYNWVVNIWTNGLSKR